MHPPRDAVHASPVASCGRMAPDDVDAVPRLFRAVALAMRNRRLWSRYLSTNERRVLFSALDGGSGDVWDRFIHLRDVVVHPAASSATRDGDVFMRDADVCGRGVWSSQRTQGSVDAIAVVMRVRAAISDHLASLLSDSVGREKVDAAMVRCPGLDVLYKYARLNREAPVEPLEVGSLDEILQAVSLDDSTAASTSQPTAAVSRGFLTTDDDYDAVDPTSKPATQSPADDDDDEEPVPVSVPPQYQYGILEDVTEEFKSFVEADQAHEDRLAVDAERARAEARRSASSSLADQLASTIGLTGIKHLVAAIERNRADVVLTDVELRKLFVDVKSGKSKYADESKVGQEELYTAIDDVVNQLWNFKTYSRPFHYRVKKQEAPDYFLVIRRPMDLSKVKKKISQRSYRSKTEFAADLCLIYDNCLLYNGENNQYGFAAIQMRNRTEELLKSVPDITVRSRAEVEKEEEDEESDDGGDKDGEQQIKRRKVMGAEGLAPGTDDEHEDDDVANAGDLPAADTVANGPDVEMATVDDDDDDDNGNDDVLTSLWKARTRRLRGMWTLDRRKYANVPFADRPLLVRDAGGMRQFAEQLSAAAPRQDLPQAIFLPELEYSQGLSKLWDSGWADKRETRSRIVEPKTGSVISMKRNIGALGKIKRLHDNVYLLQNPLAPLSAYRSYFRPSTHEAPSSTQVDTTINADNVLDDVTALDGLKQPMARILLHSGFSSASDSIAHLFTEIFAEKLTSMAKTLSGIAETYGNKLSAEALVARSLSLHDIRIPHDIIGHIRGDINAYGVKLVRLCDKLDSKYKKLAANIESGVSAEDLNEDSIVCGSIAEITGEDFFGLNELGLGQVHIPAVLWKARAHALQRGVSISGEKLLVYSPPAGFAQILSADGHIELIRDHLREKLEQFNGELIEDEFVTGSKHSKPQTKVAAQQANAKKRSLISLPAASSISSVKANGHLSNEVSSRTLGDRREVHSRQDSLDLQALFSDPENGIGGRTCVDTYS